jgi:hypothetical protein
MQMLEFAESLSYFLSWKIINQCVALFGKPFDKFWKAFLKLLPSIPAIVIVKASLTESLGTFLFSMKAFEFNPEPRRL